MLLTRDAFCLGRVEVDNVYVTSYISLTIEKALFSLSIILSVIVVPGVYRIFPL